MVDLREPSNQQSMNRGDPLGATGVREGQARASFSPTLPPYTPLSGKARLITVTYTPPGHDQTLSHTALVPWTNNYDAALTSIKAAFQRYFPSGSSDRHWWLSTRLQTSSGTTWAEISPEAFQNVVGELNVELRLCEEPAPKPDVSLLPIGHEHETSDLESYYQFKIITVGDRSVGKSMMLQSFTRNEEERLDTLPNTVGPRMDIVNRFMTTHGELVKTILWDTAGQEEFRAMTKPLYRGANGVFLVYSIASLGSFNQCTSWLTEIRKNVDDNTLVMLIGNQIDRNEERVVQTSDAEAFALEHGLLFAEVSGKYGTNLDHAFQQLVREIYNQLKSRDELYRFKESKRTPRNQPFPKAKAWQLGRFSQSGKCCA